MEKLLLRGTAQHGIARHSTAHCLLVLCLDARHQRCESVWQYPDAMTDILLKSQPGDQRQGCTCDNNPKQLLFPEEERCQITFDNL